MMKSMVIQPVFATALDEVIHVFQTEFPIELHSLYVYGSVAQGTAIAGKSDLDLCVVFYYPADDLERKISEIQSYIMNLYPMFPKIDVDIGYLKDVLDPKNQKRWGHGSNSFVIFLLVKTYPYLFNIFKSITV